MALPPGAKLVTQVVGPTGTKPALADSLTVYVVFGERPVKLPVRVTVVPMLPPLKVSEPLVPLPVRLKVKLPLPPSTCLVTTICPLA